MLQLARHVESVNRNFDERLLTGADLDMAKAFDNLWVKAILYKLTVLNFPFYMVKIVSSFLDCRTIEKHFQTAMSAHRVVEAGVAPGGLVSPVLFSLYVNDIPHPPVSPS
jgi:hypothetical protein